MNFKLIKCRRKSISISISENNLITVRCPYSMSEKRVQEFIDSKHNWIKKVTKANAERALSFKDILEYKRVLINGNSVPIIYSDISLVSDSAIHIKDKNNIKELLIKTFAGDLCAMARDISKEIGISAVEFSVKAYKSRWGCCRRDGIIILNYLLIMLPVELQRYIIIHELCHRIFFNHSKEFWKLVGRFEPQYKMHRNELKSFNYLINLY